MRSCTLNFLMRLEMHHDGVIIRDTEWVVFRHLLGGCGCRPSSSLSNRLVVSDAGHTGSPDETQDQKNHYPRLLLVWNKRLLGISEYLFLPLRPPTTATLLRSPASHCQSSRSESVIPDQGEHPERPYSQSQQHPVPIVLCLSLRQCSHAPSYVLLKFNFVSASFKSLWTCGSHLSSTSSALQLEVCGSPLFFFLSIFFAFFLLLLFPAGFGCLKVEEMWVTLLLLGGIIIQRVCAHSPWRPLETSGDPTQTGIPLILTKQQELNETTAILLDSTSISIYCDVSLLPQWLSPDPFTQYWLKKTLFRHI